MINLFLMEKAMIPFNIVIVLNCQLIIVITNKNQQQESFLGKSRVAIAITYANSELVNTGCDQIRMAGRLEDVAEVRCDIGFLCTRRMIDFSQRGRFF